MKSGGAKTEYIKQVCLALFLAAGFAVLIPPLKLWDHELITKYDLFLRLAVVAAAVISWAVCLWKSREVDAYVLSFALFCGMVIAVTFIRGADLKRALWSDTAIPLSCIFLLLFGTKTREDVLIRVLYVLYYLFSIINLVTMYVDLNAFLGEGDQVYFFANRNLHLYFYLIPLFCGYYGLRKGYLKSVALYLLFYVLCLVSISKAGGLTAAIVSGIWGVFLLFRSREWVCRITAPWVAFLLNAVLFFFLMTYSLADSSILAKQLDTFGKSANFSGRTPIWREVLEQVFQAPLLGHGAVDMTALFGYRHAHNIYLQVLYSTGIPGLLTMVLLLVLLYHKIDKMKNRDTALLMQVLLFCILLAGQFDVGYLQYYALYGGLVYCLDRTIPEKTGQLL